MERHTKEQSEGKEEEREEETEVEEKEGKAGGCLQSPYYIIVSYVGERRD